MDTAANVIAIVDLAFKVIKYMNDVREGGKERSELHQEVLNVYELLWSLKYEFEFHDLDEETAWSKPIKPLFKPGGIVDQLKLILEQVSSKLVLPSRSIKGTLKKIKWPFDKPEVQRILGRLRSLIDGISTALDRANLEVGVDTNKHVKFLRHFVDSAELETVLKWISPLDFRALQNSTQRRPLSGTGTWFFNNPQVRGWSGYRTKVLWCHGIPGAGKTVLATALFKKLQEKHAGANVAVLIAYCSFDDANTHSSSNIVSSFLRQLIEKRGKIPDAVRKLYTEHTQHGEQSRPSQEKLVEALSSELETFDKAFIIVDGLDELRENKQKVGLLQTIESLHPLPQLLVTSRPVESIKQWFTESANEDRYRTRADFGEEEYSYYYCDNCDKQDEHYQGNGEDFSEDDGSSSDSDTVGGKFETIEAPKDEQPEPDSEGKNEDWINAACYRCKTCKRDVCVKCYEQYDICFGCNQSKECFIWAWPGTVTVTAHLDDLEQYILWRIDNNDNLKFLLETAGAKAYGLLDTIVTRVQEESHKMFLLAKFHMNALEQQVTARDLINALKVLPSNINDIYNSVFNRISSQRIASTLEKLLIIIATARKLLSAESLAHAITIKQDHDDIDELALPDVRHLVSMCAGLVIIDPSGYVRLAHETIGNYIATNGLKQSKNGHETLAEICLLYLHFSAFASGACVGPKREVLIQNRETKYPLLRYAATHWGIHTQLAHGPVAPLTRTPSLPRTDVVRQLARELMSKQENVAAAAQFMWLDDIEASSGWDAEENVHGLHLSAYFGLTEIVSGLIATGVDVDIEDCLQTTPLMYAAQAGHTNIVYLLLHSGADPSRICRRGRTALHRACEKSYATVVMEIVSSSKDVAVNVIDGGSSCTFSALMWAVRNENTEIVKHLLTRKDIDVNLKRPNHYRSSALHYCVIYEQIDIARLLLSDARTEINAVNASRKTALTLAVQCGYGDMVALLLEKGADTDARDIYDGPALLRAVDENALECVRILVEHGVDYKFKDFHARNILHGCAINGRGTIMRYLLKNLPDLDPNAQGDSGETPLHDAVGRNAEAVVRVLLEYGARTDIKNKHGKTPLRLAREQDLDRLFDLLRSARLKEQEAEEHAQHNGQSDLLAHPRRADTLAVDYKMSVEIAVRKLDGPELENYLNEGGAEALEAIKDQSREVLNIAVRYGRCDNLRILLDRGADINSRDNWGHTLLHASIYFNKYEIAELLLNRGCSINERDLMNRTPLTFCTLEQFRPMFGFLLVKRGATFDRSERDSLVPTLRYAVECDEFEVVKILVEAGVPFRIKDTTGQTPYQQAKRAGHKRIAQYLYEQARKERTTSTNSTDVTTAAIEATGNLTVESSEEKSDPAEGKAEVILQTKVKILAPKEDEAQADEKALSLDVLKSKEALDKGVSRSWKAHIELTRREIYLSTIIVLLIMLLLYK
ncbi:ankyrin [Xylaria telfairii]|nr:ankyrin [Xylaria telfairii]